MRNLNIDSSITNTAEETSFNEEIKKNKTKKENRYLSNRKSVLLLLFFPLTFIYYEIMLKAFLGQALNENLLYIIPLSVSIGLALYFLCNLPKKTKATRILSITVLALSAFLFLVEFFCFKFFDCFWGVAAMINTAGDMMGSYFDTAVALVLSGFYVVILYFIPAFVYGFFFRGKPSKDMPKYFTKLLPVFLSVIFYGAAVIGIMTSSNGIVTDKEYYTSEFNITESTNRFGLATGLRLDIQYFIFGTPKAPEIEIVPDPIIDPSSSKTESSVHGSSGIISSSGISSEPVIEYGYNKMDIDFDSLIENTKDKNIKSMHEYFAAQTPTKQNKYTGMFKGKNVIVITAEALSYWAIDEELTPTLYRMMTKGIYFKNYYQPAWGYSTSDGEYSHTMGLVPEGGTQSMYKARKNNLYFTVGNQTTRLGYTTLAYHNNTHTYYKRNETHKNLGYSKFIAIGSGLEGLDKWWPRSDLQLMEHSVDDYIDKAPFSIYYMTVSGHANYNFTGNYMAYKNQDAVKNLKFTEAVKAYKACNLELEYAMDYLINRLTEAGIADDTVIVMTGDHYPYGLEEDSTNPDVKYKNFDNMNGSKVERNVGIHKNVCIIWSKCLEDMEPIVVEEPTYSLDILPTVSNLFGFEYDSRLMVGRDVFSDANPLVLFRNYSWITDKGYYNAKDKVFTPNEGVTVSEDYIKQISQIVKNKVTYSKYILDYDYYGKIFGKKK